MMPYVFNVSLSYVAAFTTLLPADDTVTVIELRPLKEDMYAIVETNLFTSKKLRATKTACLRNTSLLENAVVTKRFRYFTYVAQQVTRPVLLRVSE
jgi:hypothetical protein